MAKGVSSVCPHLFTHHSSLIQEREIGMRDYLVFMMTARRACVRQDGIWRPTTEVVAGDVPPV